MTAQPRGIGDNNGPPLYHDDAFVFIAWVMGVIRSKMSPAAKSITIAAVCLQTASEIEIATVCQISEKTVVRFKKECADYGWINIVPITGRGKRASFSPAIPGYGRLSIFDPVLWRRIAVATGLLQEVKPGQNVGQIVLNAIQNGQNVQMVYTDRTNCRTKCPEKSETPNEINGSPAQSAQNADNIEKEKDIIPDNHPAGGAPPNDNKPNEASKRKKRKTQIDPDWKPSPDQRAWVKATWAASDSEINRQVAKFIDHHLSKGSLMADWPAAWRYLVGHRLPQDPT
jgi:hypothetical protein